MRCITYYALCGQYSCATVYKVQYVNEGSGKKTHKQNKDSFLNSVLLKEAIDNKTWLQVGRLMWDMSPPETDKVPFVHAYRETEGRGCVYMGHVCFATTLFEIHDNLPPPPPFLVVNTICPQFDDYIRKKVTKPIQESVYKGVKS